MAAWSGPRHRSWGRDTNLTAVFAGAVVVGYVVWELVGEAPQGMVTLVGLAGGALFGAVSSDKKKRDRDTAAEGRESGPSLHRHDDDGSADA